MLVELENKWIILCQKVNPKNGSLTYQRYIEKANTLIEACFCHEDETIVLARFYHEGEDKNDLL